ncbi:hypothetical protein NDU88_010662 [Pleurodeles waltl]|uniref:Uncharacterized protein n=1 Tax=Pleurodeles waltl TaxID=8319 RepID=A0AAV7Q0U4_PLEWA|nr:hypothetical protein NDU88_010662 [Pleurodeles waltl]
MVKSGPCKQKFAHGRMCAQLFFAECKNFPRSHDSVRAGADAGSEPDRIGKQLPCLLAAIRSSRFGFVGAEL